MTLLKSGKKGELSWIMKFILGMIIFGILLWAVYLLTKNIFG